MLLPGFGVGGNVVVAPFGEREPGGELVGPGDNLAVPGLEARVVGGLTCCLGRFALAEVVVQAAKQQGQPARGDE